MNSRDTSSQAKLTPEAPSVLRKYLGCRSELESVAVVVFAQVIQDEYYPLRIR